MENLRDESIILNQIYQKNIKSNNNSIYRFRLYGVPLKKSIKSIEISNNLTYFQVLKKIKREYLLHASLSIFLISKQNVVPFEKLNRKFNDLNLSGEINVIIMLSGG